MAGLPVAVPGALRNTAFAALGVTLGSGASPDLLAEIARWPLALAVLPIALVAMTLASMAVLRALADLRGPTALLATSPGALSFALALAEDRAGKRVDASAVVGLQSLRLLLITVLLPLIVVAADSGGRSAGSGPDGADLSTAISLALLGLGLAIGWGLAQVRLPAAWLFGGLTVSLALHATGIVEGRPTAPVTLAAFVVVGAAVGARFITIRRSGVMRLFTSGALATVAAATVAAAFALPVAIALGIPFGQVWVAYAPGGVEAMAAIGFALGYDPMFVAFHHIARLLLIVVGLPIALNRADRDG